MSAADAAPATTIPKSAVVPHNTVLTLVFIASPPLEPAASCVPLTSISTEAARGKLSRAHHTARRKGGSPVGHLPAAEPFCCSAILSANDHGRATVAARRHKQAPSKAFTSSWHLAP